MKRVCLVLIVLFVGCSPLRSEFYRNQTDFLYTEANRAYSGGKYEQAKKGYEEVIALDPTYSEAYVGLGHCAMIEGRYKEALGFYERALALNPRLRPTLQELICAASVGDRAAPKNFAAHQVEEQFNQGNYRQIIAERRGKSPLTEADSFWLIRSLVRLKEYHEAAAVVHRLCAEHANLEQMTERMTHLDAFLSQGHTEALADFRTLADMNPGCQECRYLYGIMLFNNSSQYGEVIKRLETVRRAGYSPRPLLVSLAMAYEKSDRVIEAVETYRQLGDDLFAYERLHHLFIKLGDMEEARRYDALARQQSAQ